MANRLDVSGDWARIWNGSIALKVTAITIWMILVISFVLTIPFVSSFEELAIKRYTWQRIQAEEVIHRASTENASLEELLAQLKTLLASSEIQYIKLGYRQDEIDVGVADDSYYTISSNISDTANGRVIPAQFDFPSLPRAVSIARVKVGSAIVGFSVSLGLLLFWINRNIIQTPFNAIVELTRKVSAGENHHRLDEFRNDEFGVLARFLNAMLDALDAKETALKKANSELVEEIRHREEALAASRQKSAFLANMSHEIRTPLSSIIGYSERLRFDKARSAAEQKQMLDIVLNNGNHLLHLINDILDLSKVEANKIEIDNELFSIFQLVDQTRRLINDRAMEHDVQLRIEYDFPIPEQIYSDAHRIKQILLNLLSNAIRFTAHGTVTIVIAYEPEDDMLLLTVKDTGIGMTRDEVNNLFKPFSQADASISRKFGGTGLGLSISRRLAELMEGDIHVDSIKGLGSSFTCRVKAGFDHGQNRLLTSREQVDLGTVEYEQPLQEIRLGGKILLVEDTPEIQGLVKACLEDYGVEIDTANNGKEGVEKALAFEDDYDLVLMDIQMPVMSGKDATRQLRLKQFKKPVVALTADALTEHRQQFLEIGFNDILTKPISVRDLVSAVKRYLLLEDTDRTRKPDPVVSEMLEFAGPGMKSVFSNLQSKFISQLPMYVDNIRTALKENDLDEAHLVLHQLKGIGGSLGVSEVTRLAGAVSDALYSNDLDTVQLTIQQIAEFCNQPTQLEV